MFLKYIQETSNKSAKLVDPKKYDIKFIFI